MIYHPIWKEIALQVSIGIAPYEAVFAGIEPVEDEEIFAATFEVLVKGEKILAKIPLATPNFVPQKHAQNYIIKQCIESINLAIQNTYGKV